MAGVTRSGKPVARRGGMRNSAAGRSSAQASSSQAVSPAVEVAKKGVRPATAQTDSDAEDDDDDDANDEQHDASELSDFNSVQDQTGASAQGFEPSSSAAAATTKLAAPAAGGSPGSSSGRAASASSSSADNDEPDENRVPRTADDESDNAAARQLDNGGQPATPQDRIATTPELQSKRDKFRARLMREKLALAQDNANSSSSRIGGGGAGASGRAGLGMGAGGGGKGKSLGRRQLTRSRAASVKRAKDGISKNELRRLARRGGVKRISLGIYDEARQALHDFLSDILFVAVGMVDYRRAKTLTLDDVIYAFRVRGRTLYGFR